MLRFLLHPRWIGLTVFASVAVVVCVMLGLWQLDRLEERRALNERIEAGRAVAPAPLQDLLDVGGALDHRRAAATGSYDVAHEVILYGRTLEGQPGNHVLTPLVLDDGTAIVVDRGWVPFEMDEPPVAEAAPPDGDVEVEGALLAPQPGGAGSIQPGADRVTIVRSVDVEAIARDVPYDLLPWFLQLQVQSPPPGRLPVPEPPAELTQGPHLSYALQWFAFATIAAVGYAVLVRREIAHRRSAAA
ncbi:MAG TPA: SURF1 family protein, partial [Actinomycetota bacterium]|nr:SURF1 family protein [Actinomycetota bacterium]